MKLGVLGGTFDPIHLGHLELAQAAIRNLDLDAVHLIPCRRPPHKERPQLTPGADRLAMIALATQHDPRLVPDSRELDGPVPSFTIDTLRLLQKAMPEAEIFFLMGMDSFREIHQWKEYESLLSDYHLVVLNRPGSPPPPAEQLPAAARRHMAAAGTPPATGHSRVHILEMPPHEISSTEIRRRAGEGSTLKGLVPAAVESYIQRCRLYR